jgi:ribose-phosphate pyrophosphokinase
MKHYQISMPTDEGVKYRLIKYPGGEKQIQIVPTEFAAINEAAVVDVWAQIQNGEIMDLALLTSALAPFYKKSSVNGGRISKVNLYLPYLPYARADRRFVEGDCEGLASFAWLLNQLDYDNVYTYDVHSKAAFEHIQNLVEKPIRPFLEKAINHIGGLRGLTIILPDKGAQRYMPLLNEMGIKRIATGGKVRDPQTGKLSGFTFPPVKVKKGLIIDDICDGGGTFLGLADKILETNPKAKLYLYTTHGIYSQGTGKLLEKFEQLYCTGTFKSASRGEAV